MATRQAAFASASEIDGDFELPFCCQHRWISRVEQDSDKPRVQNESNADDFGHVKVLSSVQVISCRTEPTHHRVSRLRIPGWLTYIHIIFPLLLRVEADTLCSAFPLHTSIQQDS